jgi:hypothetical protein
MFLAQRKAALGVAAAVQLLLVPGPAVSAGAERVAESTKSGLTPNSLPALHALIRPHEDEWRHLKVHWLTDVVAARRRAAEEDKPIVICYTGGAGYNEPLGIC